MGNKISTLMANFKSSNVPIIVILGETGTGKSKLALELAKKFNGEIISADSMQVYKGLDIITNKVTPEEQKQVVHHFINCVDSTSRYTVVDFRNRALPLINSLLQKHKLPIIVGGTNYYIESLLWNVLVKPEDSAGNTLLYDSEKEKDTSTVPTLQQSVFPHPTHSVLDSEQIEYSCRNIFQSQITQETCKEIPSAILHKILTDIDPAMASTLHPNNKRKIVRSLQVYQQYKRCHSDLLKLQKSLKGGSSLGGPLRYKNSIMLWVQCDREVLNKRLKERVDEMMEKGLIDELLDFHKAYNESRINKNQDKMYQEGIFQSIGFKEFHEYLILPEHKRSSEKGIKMREKGIEDVKMVTKRYAKKQVKWIKNRFLRKPDRDVPPVFGLNATDLSLWKENVFDVACNIVEATLEGKEPLIKPLPVEEFETEVQESHFCEICDKVIVGRKTWQVHLNSRIHHKMMASLKKQKPAEKSNSP